MAETADTVRADLRGKAHGHDAAEVDADAVPGAEIPGTIRVYQDLLPRAAVPDQQITLTDLQHPGPHDGGHSGFHQIASCQRGYGILFPGGRMCDWGENVEQK